MNVHVTNIEMKEKGQNDTGGDVFREEFGVLEELYSTTDSLAPSLPPHTGDIYKCLETFQAVTTGEEGCCEHRVGRVQGCCQTKMYRTGQSLTRKYEPTKNINSAGVEKT